MRTRPAQPRSSCTQWRAADANDCFAVGSLAFNLHGPEALILQWNGGSWSVVPSATGRAAANLEGVTCFDATTCYAVGTLINAGPLVERWNGSVWSTVPTPGVPGSGFAGVACAAIVAMLRGWFSEYGAVGDRAVGRHDVVRRSESGGAGCVGAVGRGVSRSDELLAVGARKRGVRVGCAPGALGRHRLVTDERCCGIAGPYNLHGVACAGPSSCFAVGESHSSTVVLGCDGTAWSLVATPNPQTLNTLSAVACVTTTTCSAVGTHAFMATLADQWDGQRWTSRPSPNPAQPSDALTRRDVPECDELFCRRSQPRPLR